MTSYRLTRFLYPVDEVELSLVNSLLTRRNPTETSFWAAELHASGVDPFTCLWQAYFDFYAELSPRLESYLAKQHRRWRRSPSMTPVTCAVRNLLLAPPTPAVFMLRQFVLSGGSPVSLARGKRPDWCGDYERRWHLWLLAVDRDRLPEAAYYTYTLAQDNSTLEMVQVLARYFAMRLKADVPLEALVQHWRGRLDTDDCQYLLSMLVGLSRPAGAKGVRARRLFLQPSEEDVEEAEAFAGGPGGRREDQLPVGRRFRVDPLISGFHLARDRFPDVSVVQRLQWERFISYTPLWRGRLEASGIPLKDGCAMWEEAGPDAIETFYSAYGLEPDEQSQQVQDLGCPVLPKATWSTWYGAIFGQLVVHVEMPIGGRLRQN